MHRFLPLALVAVAGSLAGSFAASARAMEAVDHASSPSAEGSEDALTPRGVQVSARVGYGLPAGSVAQGTSLASVDTAMTSFWIDAGWRFSRHLFVGAFAQLGVVELDHGAFGGGCNDPSNDCTARDWRFGVEAHWHFAPGRAFDPWVGLGVGYEIHSLSVDASGATAPTATPVAATKEKGFELADLQVGGDFRLAPHVGLGPFAAVTLGQFSSCTSDAGDCALGGKAFHAWLLGGVRGVFDV